MHRARGRLRTDEVRHELQTLQALRYGQVKMDFAFFAIAFNIKKMCSKINKKSKRKPFGAANTAYFCLLAVLTTLETTKNGILTKKSA